MSRNNREGGQNSLLGIGALIAATGIIAVGGIIPDDVPVKELVEPVIVIKKQSTSTKAKAGKILDIQSPGDTK